MIRAVIVGDPNKVPQYLLRKFPEIQGACQVSMARLVLKLTSKIKGEKLSGQVLKNKTGTLRRSITPSVSNPSGTSVQGKVSTNVEYASIHEFGFSGQESVKAHLRLMKEAFGKPLRFPVYANIAPFTRTMNMPERSFMRTALEEMRPEILEEFNNAVMQVVSKK